MIEIVYKEEKKNGNEHLDFIIPRNIRQIGEVEGPYRIYIEDYVYTFLQEISKGDNTTVAILLGRVHWEQDTTYIFVEGALKTDEAEISSEHISFSEETWQKLQEEKAKFFPEQEVTGWFMAEPQLDFGKTEGLLKAHLKYFGGEKILFLINSTEKEEIIFRYENNFLIRQNGYYIFFEKNIWMQTYMIEKNYMFQTENRDNTTDETVRKIRKIIKNKKQERESAGDIFSGIAAACLLLAVLSVGMNFYKYWQKEPADQKEYTAATVSQSNNLNDIGISSSESKLDKENKSKELNVQKKEDEKISDSDDKINKEEHKLVTKEELEEIDLKESSKNNEDLKDTDEVSVAGETEKEHTSLENNLEKNDNREEGTDNNTEETLSENLIERTYVIRPGDTLYQICLMKYGSLEKIDEICKVNKITKEEIIYPGQIIVLP